MSKNFHKHYASFLYPTSGLTDAKSTASLLKRSSVRKETSGLVLHLSGCGLESFMMKSSSLETLMGHLCLSFCLHLSLHHLVGTLSLKPILGLCSSYSLSLWLPPPISAYWNIPKNIFLHEVIMVSLARKDISLFWIFITLCLHSSGISLILSVSFFFARGRLPDILFTLCLLQHVVCTQQSSTE